MRSSSRIMYLMGGCDRCISRYVGQYLIEYGSIVDQVSVDTRSSIGRYIGQASTNVSTHAPIGQYTWWFTETSLILHRYCTDTAPVRYLTDTIPSPSVLVDWFIYRLIHWSTLDWSINALVLFSVSANTLVDRSVDSIKYQSIYCWIVSSITLYVGLYIGRWH